MVSVHWMEILSVNMSPVKSFMAYNFCCDGTSTQSKLKKIQNMTVLLEYLTALLE